MTKGVAGSLAPHGTRARYNTHGCRCVACTRATRDFNRVYYNQRPRESYLADIEPPHGTESRYTSTRFRCRCGECREAARVAKARRRAAVRDAA